MDPRTLPLTLYVHLPWCVHKCPYCDFNSYAAPPGALPDRAYVEALLRDLETDLPAVPGRALDAIFIGGGTPSLFSGEAIARLLDGVRARVACVADVEVTLEANPGAIDAAHFTAYRAAGINRLSLGLQSMRDATLARLGRVHRVADSLRAVEIARAAGFANFNLDLMYGLPGDRKGDALRDLARALALAPTHFSWYQLTLEPGTAFGRRPPRLPSAERIADDGDAGVAALEAAGFARYEVSAYARPGHEARHNLNYWQFGDYLGIGAGAHGKLTTPDGIVRTARRRHPLTWQKEAGTPAALTRETITTSACVTEFMLNALRLARGFPRALFAARTGLPDHLLEPGVRAAVDRGWLEDTAGWLRPTARGYRFLNDLQLLFVP
ncbi:MAG: radical SAM family heme chaperone HemW [Gammaproteobacteria bacterium]